MRQYLNPKTVAAPFSRYSHAVEITGARRWLHISGQVGIRPDGEVPQAAEAQIEQAWQNVLALLQAADMTPQDLVKVTAFLVRPDDLASYRTIRDRMLQGAEPAGTLLIVAGLASPDWLVEIEASAACEH